MATEATVDAKIREQFSRWEAEWDLATAQQLVAQVPEGLVDGQTFKVMNGLTPIWCNYDGAKVMALMGKDAHRAAVQIADKELATAVTVELPEEDRSGVDNLHKRFPDIPRDTVEATLKLHGGHEGQAASALADMDLHANEPDPKLWSLEKRFNTIPRDTVAATLKEHGGHVGRTAKALAQMHDAHDLLAPKPPPLDTKTMFAVEGLRRAFPNIPRDTLLETLREHGMDRLRAAQTLLERRFPDVSPREIAWQLDAHGDACQTVLHFKDLALLTGANRKKTFDFAAFDATYSRDDSIERAVIDEIRSLFHSYDTDDDDTINSSEFVAGVASLDLPPTCDPAEAFALLDMDGSGALSLNELCLAIGPDLLAAKQQGVTATACLTHVIANLTAPGSSNIAAPTATVMARTPAKSDMVQVKAPVKHDDTVQLWCEYCGYLCPTEMIWGDYNEMFNIEKLVGLSNVTNYVTRLKREPVVYFWAIENYHYDKREKNSEGDTESVRVTDSSAYKRGILVTQDCTETFVPNTSKRDAVLLSELGIEFTADFKREYELARDRFYAAHTGNTYTNKTDDKIMTNLVAAQRIRWHEGESEAPCWHHVVQSYACRLTVTPFACCCGPCWLYALKSSIEGQEAFTVRKSCDAFGKTIEEGQHDARGFARPLNPTSGITQ